MTRSAVEKRLIVCALAAAAGAAWNELTTSATSNTQTPDRPSRRL